MNKKNIFILVGSFICVTLLGYFTYSTVSTLIKSKSVSQEVSVKENTSSDNKDKNSQNDLSERLKEPDKKDDKKKNTTDENKSEKTSNNSNNKSTTEKSNDSTNEDKKNTSDKNTNSKETLNNNDKKNKSENSKSESKNTISYSSYLKDLETEEYTLKENEKLSDVAKKFKETCTVNSSLNIIKSLNQINNTSSLESGDTVLVPVNTFQNGKKHSVKEGDTWYSIARKYYPNYNHEVVIDFLMDINPFNNDILPLGEDIFLPNI